MSIELSTPHVNTPIGIVVRDIRTLETYTKHILLEKNTLKQARVRSWKRHLPKKSNAKASASQTKTTKSGKASNPISVETPESKKKKSNWRTKKTTAHEKTPDQAGKQDEQAQGQMMNPAVQYPRIHVSQKAPSLPDSIYSQTVNVNSAEPATKNNQPTSKVEPILSATQIGDGSRSRSCQKFPTSREINNPEVKSRQAWFLAPESRKRHSSWCWRKRPEKVWRKRGEKKMTPVKFKRHSLLVANQLISA